MRLNGVATFIGSIGLAVAAAVLVILLVRYGCAIFAGYFLETQPYRFHCMRIILYVVLFVLQIFHWSH